MAVPEAAQRVIELSSSRRLRLKNCHCEFAKVIEKNGVWFLISLASPAEMNMTVMKVFDHFPKSSLVLDLLSGYNRQHLMNGN
jgi:hypothetical protein